MTKQTLDQATGRINDMLKAALFPELVNALHDLLHAARHGNGAAAWSNIKEAADAVLAKAAPAIAADAAYKEFQRENPDYDLPKTAATGRPPIG